MHILENTIKSGKKANQTQILVIQGVEKIETTILFNEFLSNNWSQMPVPYCTSDKHFKRKTLFMMFYLT